MSHRMLDAWEEGGVGRREGGGRGWEVGREEEERKGQTSVVGN